MKNLFSAKLLAAVAVFGLSVASVPASALVFQDFTIDEASVGGGGGSGHR